MVETQDINTNAMHVVILTPYKRLLDISSVTGIFFPAGYGTIGVFPGHAPLVTSVGTGVVVYNSLSDISGYFKIAGGIAEITGNSVVLLVDIGENALDIDVERARKSLERAEARLAAAKDAALVDAKRAEAAKARALARIEASELQERAKSSKKDSN